MKFPSWREFTEKISKFEKSVDAAIGKNVQAFQDSHPLGDKAVKTIISLLPSPFDAIAENIYRTSEGSDEEKLESIREFLDTIQKQGEEQYNNLSTKSDTIIQEVLNLKDITAKESSIEAIKKMMIGQSDTITQQLEQIKEDLTKIKIENRTVINLVNPSKEVIAELLKIKGLSTGITMKQELSKGNAIKDSQVTERHINKFLNVMQRADSKSGKITKITLNKLQISRNELLLKKFMLQGNRYFFDKKYEKAKNSYDKGIGIAPEDIDAWNNRGYALFKLGRLDEAMESFDKSLSIQPKFIPALGNKAEAYASINRYGKALEYYNKILRLDGTLPDAWYNKGVVLDRMGKVKESKKCFATAQKIQTN